MPPLQYVSISELRVLLLRETNMRKTRMATLSSVRFNLRIESLVIERYGSSIACAAVQALYQFQSQN